MSDTPRTADDIYEEIINLGPRSTSMKIAKLEHENKKLRESPHALELQSMDRQIKELERENQQLRANLDKWSNAELIGETDRCKLESLSKENQQLREGLKLCAEALQANGIFHTPLQLRKNGHPWDDYQIDAINRTSETLSHPTVQAALKQSKV